MAQILSFRRCTVFDPEAIRAMGDAYDKAMATLPADVQYEFVVRELIAKRIVRMAQKGVVDRSQLCMSALSRVA